MVRGATAQRGKQLTRTSGPRTTIKPGAPPFSAYCAERVGDETLNQKCRSPQKHSLLCTNAPNLPISSVILSGRKSAKDLARTASTPFLPTQRTVDTPVRWG